MSSLIITADDYGYFPEYDRGILEVATAGRVDAVSAFSTRPETDPGPLLATGVEIGLHLDLGAPGDAPRPGEEQRRRAAGEIAAQIDAFGELFGTEPAYLDGHHHCHAREGLGTVVADTALAHGLPVRSAHGRQRRLLRCRGVPTQDLLIGRWDEAQPVLPPALASAKAAAGLPGTVIWMVHPGYRAARPRSAYDAGREDDIRMLLDWTPPEGVERATHRSALRNTPA
jgi:predicted glycoside hydrolase/deacetylase ChbG (UPF0249 family)